MRNSQPVRLPGNQSGVKDDYPSVMCEDVRVAMSARLDGEDPGLAPEEIDGHVVGCADCSAWLTEVRRLPRPVFEAPDLTGRIMAAVAAHPVIAAGAPRPPAAAGAPWRD